MPEAVALGERPQALLTMLYRSTDCLCRCGAAVKNLTHSASFQSLENNAPSNPGLNHLTESATDLKTRATRFWPRSLIHAGTFALHRTGRTPPCVHR